jgi:hypothetical protein
MAGIVRMAPAVGAVGVLVACGGGPSSDGKGPGSAGVTPANSCTPNIFAGAFDGEVTLCQNWTAADQRKFWFLGQGSQIIPYSWFLALEQADSETPFRDDAHMDALRYLPQRPTPENPDGLPIGFTRDTANGNDAYAEISAQWLGLTCAACHTGQVEFAGHKVLVDGAPTMADFEGLTHGLVAAMQATLADDAKFARFAKRVRAPGVSDTALHRQLAEMIAVRQAWNERNGGAAPYGFARLDAIGAIFNEVTVSAMHIPGNREPANAPVSYPFIWDTPQHDRVQWNGSVENAGPGALGRNVGEVLGVFGSIHLDITPLPIPLKGHRSSVDVKHLGELEALLWRLESPQWPETILPPIDRAGAVQAKGRGAYEKFCVSCHLDIDRTSPERRITAQMKGLSEIGTDPLMAKNFADNRYASGRLKGHLTTYLPPLLPQLPQRFGADDQGVTFLGYAVIGSIFHELIKDPKGTIDAINAGRPERAQLTTSAVTVQNRPKDAAAHLKLQNAVDTQVKEPAYKARPLNGIWATAPYLHNGSVRTLRQLLLPASSRQATFQVGSREYDAKDMGYVDAGGFRFDTTVPGNSNAGHEGLIYGNAELAANPDELDALLEYLKTL